MKNRENNKVKWINEETVMEWLGVSRRCLADWRAKGIVDYTQIRGRNTMYNEFQILEILNENSTINQ